MCSFSIRLVEANLLVLLEFDGETVIDSTWFEIVQKSLLSLFSLFLV